MALLCQMCQVPMTALTLNLDSVVQLTDEQFYRLCQTNRDLKFERTATGELVVIAPTGGESSIRNADLTTDLNFWNRKTKLGVVFDSSGGFRLPNGADRSPDVAWVAIQRWQSLTPEQREKFPPIAPDFAIEIHSPSDELKPLQEKMQEYIKNGVRLGWLLDPQRNRVEIYRPNQEVETVECPATLSGEDVLPGFTLDVRF
jgi:Uncharacterized protein conserved in cyanobacteria